MEELYLFDQDDNFITILSKEEGLVDTWFKDYQNHIPDESFVFNIDSNSELLQHIKEENQVAFYDRDNDLRLMRMKEIYEVSTKDDHNIRVKCEPSYLELYDHFIEDKRITNGTAQTALNRALEGSRYVGEVTVNLGNATDNFYWIDGVEAVFKVIGTWGGALKDTITLDEDNEIIERKLWIVQRLGTDNGLIVEPDHNAESISRKTLSYVETALWGQGSSLETDGGGFTRYITFEDVEWKVSNGDPVDKPLGQKWVGDPQALRDHGYLHNGVRKHKFGHFSNQDYETPEELLLATWQELQERKLKEVIHEATIYEDDKEASLGDTVTILDRNYNKPIELQSQITGLEYDPVFDDKEIVIIIGKYIDMNEDLLQKEVDDLKEQIKKPRPSSVSKDSYPNIKPSTPINVVAHGSYNTIQLFWDYADEIFIKHYEVYGSQIKDFVPDEQQLLWRGQVSAFGHMIESDQTWYYRIRAVNYQGTGSDYSVQVEASTLRIRTDDIVFGSITSDLLADLAVTEDKIDHLAVKTQHIDNLSVERFHLNYGIIDDVHINNMSGEKIIAKTIGVDQLNVTNLSAITGNMGTLTAGILRSSNNNMNLNLNTGTLHMQNADFTLGNGADIEFMDRNNRIYYKNLGIHAGMQFDHTLNSGGRPMIGIGVADGKFSLNDPTFRGLRIHSLGSEGAGFGANITSQEFSVNSLADISGSGFVFKLHALNGRRGIYPRLTGSYNYDLGTSLNKWTDIFADNIKTGTFHVRNAVSSGGWRWETVADTGSTVMTFRGINTGSWNYNLGASGYRLNRIFLSYSPDVSSDERLKTGIVDNKIGLDFINDIETKQFRLIDSDGLNKKQTGIIAQQVLTVLKKHNVNVDDFSLVNEGSDGMYGVQHEQFIPILMRSDQELDRKIETVKVDVERLKIENQFLRQKIKLLEEKVA